MTGGSVIVSPILEDPVTGEGRIPTDSKPSTDNAAVAAYGLPKVSFESIQKSFSYSDSILQINFNKTVTGSGSATTTSPGLILMNSGAASSSSIKYISKRDIRQSVSKGLLFRNPVVIPDAGVVGNIREFGLYDEVSQNGWLLRLDGTVFKFIVFNNGTPTIDVDSSAWDDPFTLDANLHLYEIQTKSVASGDFDIYIDKKLRHSTRLLGTTSSPTSSKVSNPIYFRNENTTNTTDVAINIAPTSILNEGEETVRITDGAREVSVDSARRLNVHANNTILFDDKFDAAIDVVSKWDTAIVGAASFTQPVNTYTLLLSTTTGATDDVMLNCKLASLEETTGDFAGFEVGLSFQTNNPTNHRKEWGYKDSANLNGTFFRLNGGNLEFVLLKGGVESVVDINQAKPNANFHNYRIEQLGAGKITGFIDGIEIVDFSPAAISQIGSSEKRPFLRSYNIAAPATTPDDMQCHWIRLVDNSGNSVTIRGQDESGIFRSISTTSTGELRVAASTPVAPPATTPVTILAKGSVATTSDTFHVITSGKTIVIQRLSAGSEATNGGSIVELYYDVNGDLSVLTLIDDIYTNGDSDEKSFPAEFDGDGTARILLRRRRFSGGSVEMTGIVNAYET